MAGYFCMLNIIEKPVYDLIPYANNPRNNEKAVSKVAESIKEFGFKVPVVIDANDVIVCGHTRVKAAKLLDMDTVPCVVADDLTDEQVRAFRLADNKVSELAEWDFDKLDDEMSMLEEFNMEDFGFEFSEADVGEKVNAREKTYNAYNMPFIDLSRAAGYYQFPVIDGVDHVPEELIGFNYAKSSKNYGAGIHFYIDDYQFERIWNDPEEYIQILRPYDCVLTPDFSLYMNMPRAMKVWNVYRSRLIGQILQDAGLIVIPTLQWAEEETFDFCFDGLPEHSTVSISTVGVRKTDEAMEIWRRGAEVALERLKPLHVLLYGDDVPDFDFGDVDVIRFKNNVTERMKDFSRG